MKHKRRFSTVLTSLILAFIVCVSQIGYVFADEEETTEIKYINAVVDMIMGEYKFDADRAEIYKGIVEELLRSNPDLLEIAVDASTKTLDKYSDYYTREEMEQFVHYIQREYVGIGVTIERVTGGIRVVGVAPDGPAEKAGIKIGDIIAFIDGVDAHDFSIAELQERALGESGTVVKITVKRDGEYIDFTITRAAVSTSSCAYATLEDCVGYLIIAQFNSSTPAETIEALSYFDEKNIKKIIVDVRDNPGGELGSVLETLYQFVPRGKLLLTVDYKAQGYDLRFKSKAEFSKSEREVVVLVNENSASAAEVFAGAIMYNDVGVTVGERTFGKGSVQEFVGAFSPEGHELGDMKLSVAEYTLPNGESINNIGLRPTHKVKNTYEELPQDDLQALLYEKKYTVGDTAKGVYAIEQRLQLLGYHIDEVDEYFSEETAVAVKTFQAQSDLYPYGVADFTTQTALGQAVIDARTLVDKQLDKAYELLTGEKLLPETAEED